MPAALIQLAVKVSIVLIVVGTALRWMPGDAFFFRRHPGLLARSILSMNVVMPLVALSLALAFALDPVVKAVLIGLAVSPVPPFLPSKVMKSAISGSYAVALLAAEAVLALALVPLTVWGIGVATGKPLLIDPRAVAKVVFTSVLIPLAVGVAIRLKWPSVAARAVKPVMAVGIVLLVGALIPVFVGSWPVIKSLVGDGTLIAIVVMTAVGLAVGHSLGGPNENDRTVLALSTATRHPAVAIAVAAAALPGDKRVAPAVLLALLVGALASAPYSAWRKRSTHANPAIFERRKVARRTARQVPAGIRVGHLSERRK